MNRKLVAMLAVPALAIALAASAVAFVPGILNAVSTGPSTATSISAPTWKVGDTWTYNVSFPAVPTEEVLPGEMMQPGLPSDAFVLGSLKETVLGSVSTDYGSAWNVSLDLTMGFHRPTPVVGPQPVFEPISMPAATVSGFAWYRASDLAPVYVQKTVTLATTWTVGAGNMTEFGMLANATYSLDHTSTTRIWYHPPLNFWNFPLQENESWNVSSNATIRYASSFEFTGPNMTFESNHTANFTVPLRFTLRTGTFEDVATPAGTFHALSVSAYHREPFVIPDRDASATMNLTAETDLDLPPALATSWFSGQVGNVVKTDLGFGGISGFEGPRVELDLVSYSYS